LTLVAPTHQETRRRLWHCLSQLGSHLPQKKHLPLHRQISNCTPLFPTASSSKDRNCRSPLTLTTDQSEHHRRSIANHKALQPWEYYFGRCLSYQIRRSAARSTGCKPPSSSTGRRVAPRTFRTSFQPCSTRRSSSSWRPPFWHRTGFRCSGAGSRGDGLAAAVLADIRSLGKAQHTS
jgi:hypothetical protein